MDTSLSPTSIYDNELQNIQQRYVSVGGRKDENRSEVDSDATSSPLAGGASAAVALTGPATAGVSAVASVVTSAGETISTIFGASFSPILSFATTTGTTAAVSSETWGAWLWGWGSSLVSTASSYVPASVSAWTPSVGTLASPYVVYGAGGVAALGAAYWAYQRLTAKVLTSDATLRALLIERVQLLLGNYEKVTVRELNENYTKIETLYNSGTLKDEDKKFADTLLSLKHFYLIKLDDTASPSKNLKEVVDHQLLIQTIVSVCNSVDQDWTSHKAVQEALNEYVGRSKISTSITINESLYNELFHKIHSNPAFTKEEIEYLKTEGRDSEATAASKYNEIVVVLTQSKIYQSIFNEKLNTLGISHKNINDLGNAVENFVSSNRSLLDNLLPSWKEELASDSKTLTKLHAELSEKLLYIDSGKRFEEVRMYRSMIGGTGSTLGYLTPKVIGDRSLRLLLRITYLCLIYNKLMTRLNIKVGRNDYAVTSQPYIQKPMLSHAEKAGLRQLMNELNELSSLISMRVLNVNQKQLPPYSMFREMSRIGYELDDNALNSTMTDKDMATRLEKYINYLSQVTESLIIYYEDMQKKNGDKGLVVSISQLKQLKNQLQNAVTNTNKSVDSLKKELGDFFKMKNLIRPSKSSLTKVQYGGADEKQRYVQLGGKLKSLSNDEENLLNVMNQNINVLSQHMTRLGF